ncbi:glycosyltransferase family A protein [Litchfieldella xinjiangensis]|uniref:glycosyltransferase family A protein n=1 Tax=Litchfieldella xinjiangensis TaxID=1166948 RepID=UPI0005BD6F78|nr:glycosyltransferase family A protein [Halomonas xinjiangensis]
MPMFSVIVPVYNKAESLEVSLSTLYSQTYRDFEVIAVDDGSSDGSVSILEQEAQQGKLRLLHRDPPGPGGYAARNHGARHASAEWLLFFDADDVLFKQHLQTFHDAIEQHPDIEFFVNGYEKLEGNSRRQRTCELSEGRVSRSQALGAFGKNDFIHMNGVCIKASLFERLGGFPEGRFRRGGDVYFWLKLLCTVEWLHYSKEVTSLWVMDHRGVTRNHDNLVGTHPTLELFLKERFSLTELDVKRLKIAVNRKSLAWAIEKKSAGKSIRDDIVNLFYDVMRPRQWCYTLCLLFPLSLFSFTRALLR